MKDWIDRKDKLPPYDEEVEVSFDGGRTVECIGRFAEETRCMIAGIAGGHGYFRNQFEDIENHLVLTDVTHWRSIQNSNH